MGVKWVDVDRGDAESLDYRRRLAAVKVDTQKANQNGRARRCHRWSKKDAGFTLGERAGDELAFARCGAGLLPR